MLIGRGEWWNYLGEIAELVSLPIKYNMQILFPIYYLPMGISILTTDIPTTSFAFGTNFVVCIRMDYLH